MSYKDNIEPFIFRTLPMLLVLICTLIVVIITEQKWITILIIAVLDIVGIWWLYTNDKQIQEMKKEPEHPAPVTMTRTMHRSVDATLFPEDKAFPEFEKKEAVRDEILYPKKDVIPPVKEEVPQPPEKKEETPQKKRVEYPDDLAGLEIHFGKKKD